MQRKLNKIQHKYMLKIYYLYLKNYEIFLKH